MPRYTTIRKLVDTMRAVKSNPETVINTGDWTNPQWTSGEFRAWFTRCLSDKINAKDPRFPRGRKAGEEYTTELGRLRRQYIGNRVIIDWIAPILGARVKGALAHRLRCNLDY